VTQAARPYSPETLALLNEAFAIIALYNCELDRTARHVTRAKVKAWLAQAHMAGLGEGPGAGAPTTTKCK
jgi:hypothetical protein